MADSIRERIIQNAVTRAALITIANGYKTDIGSNPKRAVKTLDEGTAQTIVVIPRIEDSVKDRFGKMTHTFPLDLMGASLFDADTETNSGVSEEIYADLIKAFTSPSSPFSTLIESITHTGGGGLEMPKNEEKYAGAIASFEVKYKTVLGNPETQ